MPKEPKPEKRFTDSQLRASLDNVFYDIQHHFSASVHEMLPKGEVTDPKQVQFLNVNHFFNLEQDQTEAHFSRRLDRCLKAVSRNFEDLHEQSGRSYDDILDAVCDKFRAPDNLQAAALSVALPFLLEKVPFENEVDYAARKAGVDALEKLLAHEKPLVGQIASRHVLNAKTSFTFDELNTLCQGLDHAAAGCRKGPDQERRKAELRRISQEISNEMLRRDKEMRRDAQLDFEKLKPWEAK
jgi:hypothetical protein